MPLFVIVGQEQICAQRASPLITWPIMQKASSQKMVGSVLVQTAVWTPDLSSVKEFDEAEQEQIFLQSRSPRWMEVPTQDASEQSGAVWNGPGGQVGVERGKRWGVAVARFKRGSKRRG